MLNDDRLRVEQLGELLEARRLLLRKRSDREDLEDELLGVLEDLRPVDELEAILPAVLRLVGLVPLRDAARGVDDEPRQTNPEALAGAMVREVAHVLAVVEDLERLAARV